MALPLAYFLTWSTYGARLHGDERGSVDPQHNRPGTPFLPPDSLREDGVAARMKWDPIVFDDRQRQVVDRAIRDHCAFRNWTLKALDVRSTHVHVVVDCRSAAMMPSPERVMQELKSWGTRRLRSAALVSAERRIWTDHGSTRWINHPAGLEAALDYVSRLQDEPARWEKHSPRMQSSPADE